MARYNVWVCPKDKEDQGDLDFVCTVTADPNEIMSAIDILFPDFTRIELERVKDEA